ncbi:STAS domain-containing protein [Streptomyces cinereospinus]|uniref:Anti-sigma factor antagonist n=1 Tax=Streptomyces cinereospinus TaxID=285561 RepID=A0ABV5N0M1_9ACTN
MAEISGSTDENRLSITSASTDGIRVLTVRGEIDHDTAPQFQRALILGGDATAPRTVLDMRGVTFMDSSGINTLVAAHQEAAGTQGWVRLAALAAPVQRVLEIVGLDAVVACYPTLGQALDPDSGPAEAAG